MKSQAADPKLLLEKQVSLSLDGKKSGVIN